VDVPVTKQFRDCITPEIDAAYRSHVNELTHRYACRFVDYRDQVPDELFIDIHHLGPEGSTYFSQRIADEVLAPAWLGRLSSANP
jgi:hypothetical protein